MYFEADENSGYLYGTIWSGDANYLLSDLKNFLKNKTEATIHLHTPGGSVFDGNLIYNTLKNSSASIHIIVDGMAASMGSILMMAGDKVSMAENAFVMIHAPSGYVEGNADEMTKAATLLQSMEKIFVKMYTAKTGKSETVVKGWLKGDNWFDAETAKANGLIDEVITSVLDDMDMSAVKEMSLVALATSFDEKYNHQPTANSHPLTAKDVQPTANSQTNTQTNQKSNMKLNAKSQTVLGIAETATEDQVNAAIESLYNENETLKAHIVAEKKVKVEHLINGALTAGKITAKDKEHWEKLATADFELAQSSIEKLPGKATLPVGQQTAQTSSKNDDGRKDWTFTDWSRKDTKGLLKMKTEDPDRFNELVESANINL